MEIYQSSKSNISEHLTNIFNDHELEKELVVRKFRTTTQHGAIEGKTQSHEVLHYNLDVIIALGYRVQSPIAVRFRRWATRLLHEYIQKGFVMDDERLKQGGNRYFKELLQRIRDIRSSERNFYQQVTDIYATATDYDPRAKMTKQFFATVQNKMHYAVIQLFKEVGEETLQGKHNHEQSTQVKKTLPAKKQPEEKQNYNVRNHIQVLLSIISNSITLFLMCQVPFP